jgi:pyruvate/2-oxoglutarate dehydrogenase complex dihydrolipoamide dehydrogenase (E3) component
MSTVHRAIWEALRTLGVRRKLGLLLGASFVGPGVAELLHSATIAVAARVPIDRLWHAVSCFPDHR